MTNNPAPQTQPVPDAWKCTRRLSGDKAVFSDPCIATNPAYVKAHPDHDWIPLYTLDNPAIKALVDACKKDAFTHKGYPKADCENIHKTLATFASSQEEV